MKWMKMNRVILIIHYRFVQIVLKKKITWYYAAMISMIWDKRVIWQ